MIGRTLLAGAIAAAVVDMSAASAATSDPAERAEVLLLGGAIDRFVATQLPATFTVRGDRDAGIGAQEVTVVDARYCGGGKGGGRGRFVGVLRPGGATGRLPALDSADCRGKLDEVAKRLAAAPEAGAVAAAELIAEWVPWALRISIGDIAAAGEGGRALERTLARAHAASRPLANVETSGLRLATERGSSLDLDVALAFLSGTDGVLSTVTVACAGCAPGPGARIVDRATIAADADAAVGATLRFANRLVALYGETGPLVLELDRQRVEIRNLQIDGGEGTLTVRGRATSRTLGESAHLQIESSGADLRLAEVRGTAETEDCRALSGAASLRCTVRNAARGPAATALAAAVTGHYRGKLLRTFIAPPPFSFELGGRRLTLRLTPTRVTSTGGNLVGYGKADLSGSAR